MIDPIGQLKGGINAASELISLADDLDGVVQQVADLGKKELDARRAWRNKAVQVKGDYAFLNATDEYRRVREAIELKEQVKTEAIKRWGPKAWDEIEAIEKRQKEDFARLYTEDGHDKKAMFQLKLACFSAALIIVLIMWSTGVIRELSIAFYGD